MITLDFAAASALPETPDLDGAFPRFGPAQLACPVRRTLAIGLGGGVRLIGSRYSPDTRRLRDFDTPLVRLRGSGNSADQSG